MTTRPPILAGLTIITLFAAGVVIDSEPDLIEIDAAAPPPRVQPRPVTTATVEPEPGDGPTLGAPVAAVTTPATRGTQAQATPTVPPPTTAPAPIAGDCASWAAEFRRHGATDVEVEFFFDAGIIWRETRCGTDLLNEASGDTGICQLNPVHNRAGWFGGREFGEGGWLAELHGLTTRQDIDSPRWVDACLTMYRVCGAGPWTRPYGCANRRLEVDR